MDAEWLSLVADDRRARLQHAASVRRMVGNSSSRRRSEPPRRRPPRQRLGLLLVSAGQRLIGPQPG